MAGKLLIFDMGVSANLPPREMENEYAICASLRKRVEVLFPAKMGVRGNRCATGEPYFSLDGPFCESKRAAAIAWLDVFRAYAAGKTGVVHWRNDPPIECVQQEFVERRGKFGGDIEHCFWSVRSRLVIVPTDMNMGGAQ